MTTKRQHPLYLKISSAPDTMTVTQDHNRQTQLTLAAVLSAGAALGFVLHTWPPSACGFYPVCPIHQYTGLLCPGCGATRALAALTHGHLAEALQWNALVVGLLPVLMGYGLFAYRQAFRGAVISTSLRNRVLLTTAVLAVGFAVYRNMAWLGAIHS